MEDRHKFYKYIGKFLTTNDKKYYSKIVWYSGSVFSLTAITSGGILCDVITGGHSLLFILGGVS